MYLVASVISKNRDESRRLNKAGVEYHSTNLKHALLQSRNLNERQIRTRMLLKPIEANLKEQK